MGYLFQRMPTAYLPNEDQGMLMSQVMLPANSTLEQTQKVLDEIVKYFQENEKNTVESIMAVSGFSFAGSGQNMAMAFIRLKDWELRKSTELRVPAIVGRAMANFSKIRSAMVFVVAPPAVIELGQAQGFDFQLLDRGGVGHAGLMAARNQILAWRCKIPG